ncbi:MAG: hypothetical protein JWN20_428 [Jatrophihabitantaceae bacterium]|nr:hypothetical protein [Jatrophihabitantaceae bacterium]
MPPRIAPRRRAQPHTADEESAAINDGLQRSVRNKRAAGASQKRPRILRLGLGVDDAPRR